MKTINIKVCNENIYYEKLDNGLEIFIYPNDKVDSWYMTFTTKFGSIHKRFKYEDEEEYHEIPKGTAHFLEHLTFKTKDGDVSEVFPKYNASSNAYTSTKNTCYEVWGHTNLYENLGLLLDFVQDPYFNKETVENERGIILEEVNMHDDNIDRAIVNKINNIIYVNDYRKDKVSGESNDVNSITLDDIKIAYEYFYNPSNMFVTIAGPVNPKEVINFIKENQNKKSFVNKPKVIDSIVEPDNLNKHKDIYKMKVENDFGCILVKLPLSLFASYDKDVLADYLKIINRINFGSTSLLNEKLLDSGLIVSNIGFDSFLTDDHVFLLYDVSGEHVDEALDLIMDKLSDLKISDSDLERKKKVMLGNFVSAFDSIYQVVDRINGEIIRNGIIDDDPITFIKEYNATDANKIVSLLSLDNSCRVKFIKK